MDFRKLFFGIVIFLLIETAVVESKGRKNEKQSQNIQVRNDGYSAANSTSSGINTKETDNPVILASSPKSNLTDPTQDKKTKKGPHQRRAQHKRKQHLRRVRKMKRRNEKAGNPNPNHELVTAGLRSRGLGPVPSDPKQSSIEQRGGRTHHHKQSSKHLQRQQRRLQRRRKLQARAQKKHSKKLAEEEQMQTIPQVALS